MNPKKKKKHSYNFWRPHTNSNHQSTVSKEMMVLFNRYFLAQWKVTQIILNLQPGKPSNKLTSYWPISLLPIVSKVFEKLLLKRPIVEINRLIPNHQFGFRQRHSTIEQTHLITERINEALESKQYCSAALFYISQAFNIVYSKLLHYYYL
jgi:hypothetical protein